MCKRRFRRSYKALSRRSEDRRRIFWKANFRDTRFFYRTAAQAAVPRTGIEVLPAAEVMAAVSGEEGAEVKKTSALVVAAPQDGIL